MNGEVMAELLLALTTGVLGWRAYARRPGVALSMDLIALAALLGALEYAGVVAVTGPHHFASLLAATAGMPLLAVALRWPTGEVASRAQAASRFMLFAVAMGVLLVVTCQFTLWAQLAPAVAAVVLLVSALQSGGKQAISGALLLMGCFSLSVLNLTLTPLSGEQQFHVMFTLSLSLLVWPREQVGCISSKRNTP